MSKTAKAHGMDGTLIEADWPPLKLAELSALFSMFHGLGEAMEILSVSPRPFSAASVVATSTGRVFIKRHHRTVRDAEGLHEEHRFMEHLRAHGAPVPRVFAALSGETAIEMGEWTYEVHEAPEGVDLYVDALSWTPFQAAAHARSAGQALARLHLASEGFEAPRRKPQPLVAGFTIFAAQNPLEELQNYMSARPALAESAAARETHNDLHASNLLWSGGGPNAHATAIIDFGLADRTNAVCDLAQAIERSIVEWITLMNDPAHPENVGVHLDQFDALLDGYASVRPLSDEEAAALAPMIALCHAEFALTEADYYLGVLHSEGSARVALDDYLVGHARWFRSPSGERLLDALRRWAEMRERVAE